MMEVVEVDTLPPASGSHFRIPGFGFRVSGAGFGVSVLGLRAPSFGFLVSAFRFGGRRSRLWVLDFSLPVAASSVGKSLRR